MSVETPLTQETNNSGLSSNRHPPENYKIQLPKDVEQADSFDPFTERRVLNPTTDRDTLMHLLKASLGSGILSMPTAFRCVGLVYGIFLTIMVSTICTYCAYILVKSAHVLYYRKRKTQLTFADVAEISFADGPAPLPKLSKTIRRVVDFGLFAAYFTTCSAYAVVIAQNLTEVLQYFNYEIHMRIILGVLMIVFIFFSWIKDLKVLTPFSTAANCFMGVSLTLIVVYLGWSIKYNENENRSGFKLYGGHGSQWNQSAGDVWYGDYPAFFSITIFAIEAIGVIMPLENKMETPKSFLGLFGVLTKGMGAVTVVYIFLGVLGYWNDPLSDKSIITGEMPLIHHLEGTTKDTIITVAAIIVRLAVALAVLFTFTLQFFVCLEIFWNWVKHRFSKECETPNRIVRTGITVVAILIAIAIPEVTPLVSLIGAVCFSILGLMVPAIIESAVYWKHDKSRIYRTTKNIIICIIAILALIFGGMVACQQIKKKILEPFLHMLSEFFQSK